MLAYRTSFILYRVREFLQLFTTYFVWLFITTQQQNFFGYTQSTMLTYILVGAFVNDVIFSTRTTAIAGEINEGALTNYLIRPMSYFGYHFARDFGDKALNIVFSLSELILFFLIIHPPFIVQTNLSTLLLFVIGILLGVVLNFFISVLIGMIGFWSNEGWGPRFIFYQAIGLFSGTLFPLDILPKNIATVFQLLPFSYLTFFPAKLYLGQVAPTDIVKGFLILIFWIIVFWQLLLYVWRKGLRSYTAQGM